MYLITGMLMIMTTVNFVNVKILSKNLIGLQKINNPKKEFWWSFHISKSLQTILLALSIPFSFTHLNARIVNLNEHTIIHSRAIVNL